jgi:hypothetical protein
MCNVYYKRKEKMRYVEFFSSSTDRAENNVEYPYVNSSRGNAKAKKKIIFKYPFFYL